MRSKEEAFDYRYFPEPDLVPLAPEPAWRSAVAGALPPLPSARRASLASVAGCAADDAAVVTVVAQGLDDLVSAAVGAGAEPRLALNRAANEVAGRGRPDPRAFARVLEMESGGKLTATQAKVVLAEVLAGAGDPEEIARARGFEALGDDTLATVVDSAIAAHPDEWARLVGGEAKLTGFFVGKVMAATAGKADGKAVTALLRERSATGASQGR
jgi:aspartyl-tRNA(Asn)/glutamyl-tRNA(Gln) amidotransferase subunit B